MRRFSVILVLSLLLVGVTGAQKTHSDYVPDKKTAEQIARAILAARYGEERVKAGLPLQVDGSNREYWIVEVSSPQEGGFIRKGGGPAVWINKHSGCILQILDQMK